MHLFIKLINKCLLWPCGRLSRIVITVILVNVQVQKISMIMYSPCRRNWNFLEKSIIGISNGVGGMEIFWNSTLVSIYMYMYM